MEALSSDSQVPAAAAGGAGQGLSFRLNSNQASGMAGLCPRDSCPSS